MTLLEFDHVAKRHRQSRAERTILSDVALQVEEGEMVAVWGMRRSGRTTLLRLAAGIEMPDAGVVRFAGEDLARTRGHRLGGEIAYCGGTRTSDGRTAIERLTGAQLARGSTQGRARARSLQALERVEATDCAARRMSELDGGEEVRVALAAALVLQPRLLVIDDPVKGVDLLERDAILSLLRSLTDDDLAVLMSAGDATALAGAHRALSLSEGVLRGTLAPELAEVVPLRRRASG